jgi:transposase-like protein
MDVLDRDTFGQQQFGGVDLKDKRRNCRLIESVDTMIKNPADTLPNKLSRPAALKGFYRLMNHPSVTHESVMHPHYEWTLQQASEQQGVVLFIHDSTELDYTTLNSMADELGQIGNGNHRGYICHNSLVVLAETREAVGLACQQLHVRAKADPNETRAQRRTRETRESRLWHRAVDSIGPTPNGCRWVDVCDRGGDLFEFLDAELRLGRSFVVRAWHNRLIMVNGERYKLLDYARTLSSEGARTVEIRAKPGRAGRVATLEVAWAKVSLLASKQPRGECGTDPLVVWIIRTWEAHPPEGTEPLEWFLLVDDSGVMNFARADQCITYYEARWVVEEYHKAKKTGCGIEQLQFTRARSLQPAIAVLSVVALQLLRLRDLGRQAEKRDRPAREEFPIEWVKVLSAWRYGKVKVNLTIGEFLMALGRLGGHQNRKHDGTPGWLTLWRGWRQLQAMLAGASAVASLRSG